MKRRSYIFCFVVFFAGLLFMFSFKESNKNIESKKIEYNKANVEITKKNNISNKSSSGYWIKTLNDYIVIYNDYGDIIVNTNITIDEIEGVDKNILEKGIYIENMEKLFRYLESYTS